jgi:glycosyltransferase involved in cell wall biosynthesis
MKTLLFFGFDNEIGLTYHFVDWVNALGKASNGKLKIIFLTLKKEQNQGLHEKLKKIQSIDVVVMDKPDDLEGLEFLKDVNIVHCQGFRQAAQSLKIRKKNKFQFKIVMSLHSFRNSNWYKHIYANLVSFLYVNKIDVINFLSHSAKNEFLKHNIFYRPSNRSFVFPLGCNEDDFTREEPIEEMPFYDEMERARKNIIYLAGFSRGKQHLWLLKTIKDILIKEDAKLWLFGGDAGQREKTKRYVDENGLAQYVRMPGRVDRKYIPSILRRMNFAVCTSKSENSPHAIMEPMFSGIPVVTFDIGTASYLIRDFSNGFVIRGRTEKENFRKAVEFLLRNKEVSESMGRNNKEIAHRSLTWNTTADNCVNMYLGII